MTLDPAQLLSGSAVLAALGGILALSLRFAEKRFAVQAPPDTVTELELLLPQTQCGECGYAGCRPYAEAIAGGEAINRCPPGGEATIVALADYLNTAPRPLDGVRKTASVAYIREAECIGCTKCIQACPVDAIVGAAKLMHTVIAAECTGCDLCVEPCPVDCIDMLPLDAPQQLERMALPTRLHYRSRFHAHNARLQRDSAEQEQRRRDRRDAAANKAIQTIATEASAPMAATVPATTAAMATAKSKQDEIRAAIARARAKKASPPNEPGS